MYGLLFYLSMYVLTDIHRYKKFVQFNLPQVKRKIRSCGMYFKYVYSTCGKIFKNIFINDLTI